MLINNFVLIFFCRFKIFTILSYCYKRVLAVVFNILHFVKLGFSAIFVKNILIMTFHEALLFIQINGEYHKDGKETFKLKIAPQNPFAIIEYQSDLLVGKKVLTNEDAKKYTDEDEFIIIPFNVDVLAEENFHI